ncbi:hypothetical protein EDD27_2701 [Nonomuraea polychroma]|uniref:Uncharacterized protein n=1 Tax=Nonomuraea polychroma TaxID=46176 RepID=A0A438M3Z3_9ACTN|nr:hypothetical protein [Nonomuraea polychroma]RVX40297.1 hypothetical protein EDD27_2701 [Nonomuraea polychroma]
MDIVDARARLERPLVPVRAYRDAARHLVPPTLVVFLPLATAALLPVLSGSAVVRNDELEISGAVWQALDAVVGGLHGPALVVVSGVAVGGLTLAGTPFQASVITRERCSCPASCTGPGSGGVIYAPCTRAPERR